MVLFHEIHFDDEFNADEFISRLVIMDYPEIKTKKSEREKQTLA
jgi:hypothetical protein